MTTDEECPHGDPKPKRCALCRRDRRQASEAARLRRALERKMNPPTPRPPRVDVARLAAGDRD